MNDNCPSTSDFKEYVEAIEELKKKFKLSASQVLILTISAAYECDGRTFDELVEEYCT